MDEKIRDKNIPKGLYDVVSELAGFIDEQDYKRKEKNQKNAKDILIHADIINKGLKI